MADRLEVIVTTARDPLNTGTTAPRYTKSYYEKTTDVQVHRRQGCLARQEGHQGIVVLNYGSPRNLGNKNSPVYGAGLNFEEGVDRSLPVAVSLTQITQAVKAFADGYYRWQNCQADGFAISDPLPADLVIAVGTSNSSFERRTVVDGQPVIYHVINPDLRAEHGAAWSQMVIDLDTYVVQRRYRGVNVVGAYDIEPDWWSVDTNGDFRDERFIEPTNEWANGYLSVRGVRPYYNYGSLDGGPRDSSWLNPQHPRSQQFNQTLADVYALSSGKRRRALPQIYNAAYAKEWYQLRRYSILRQSTAITLAGVITQTGSSTRVFTDARPWQAFKLDLVNSRGTIENLPPRQGWQAMHDALHRTLIQPLTLTSNLGSPLPDSFLVAPYAAPSPTFTIVPTATCQPNYGPYNSALPYRFYGELSCFPSGTTFPQDTTFSTRFVLPSQYQPVFSAVTRQPLPWATDIQYGCLVSRCQEEQLPRQ